MKTIVLHTCIFLFAGLAAAQRLDTTNFIVMGDGLAAGQANYALQEVTQRFSFPAQMARQMGAIFPQPLIQGPGIGEAVGVPSLPVLLPTYPQTTVRVLPRNDKGEEVPSLFVFNLSVPGMKLADAVTRRPAHPLIQDQNPQQTVINMLLGFPALLFEDNVPLWTQLEYAEAMNPSLALVELGYYDVLEAALAGDPARIPTPAAFRATYQTIVKRLRGLYAEVLVTTIPDPMDTAYFSLPASAAALMRTPPFVILAGYGLRPDDFITRQGLSEMGNQFLKRKIEPLSPGSVMRASTAAEIRSRVRALNAEINNVARENGALVYDLAAFFSQIRAAGLTVGSARITGDYLGGFYSLDGVHPGPTGHALIANEMLTLLNRTYRQSFRLIDVAAVLRDDAVTQTRPAGGQMYAPADLGISESAREVSQ